MQAVGDEGLRVGQPADDDLRDGEAPVAAELACQVGRVVMRVGVIEGHCLILACPDSSRHHDRRSASI